MKKFYRLADEDAIKPEEVEPLDKKKTSKQLQQLEPTRKNTKLKSQEPAEEEAEEAEVLSAEADADADEADEGVDGEDEGVAGVDEEDEDEDEEDDSESSDAPEAAEAEEEVLFEREPVPLGDESRRIAVQNLDWARVRVRAHAPSTHYLHTYIDVTSICIYLLHLFASSICAPTRAC